MALTIGYVFIFNIPCLFWIHGRKGNEKKGIKLIGDSVECENMDGVEQFATARTTRILPRAGYQSM